VGLFENSNINDEHRGVKKSTIIHAEIATFFPILFDLENTWGWKRPVLKVDFYDAAKSNTLSRIVRPQLR
jgi:hypothetical protein